MSAPRLRTAALALGLGLVITPALTGCIPSAGDIVGGLVQQGVEQGVEQLTGVDYTESGLPNGFPSEVPLAEGELLGGAAANADGKSGWVVGVRTDRSAEDIRAQLAGAGFTSPAETVAIDGFIVAENERYGVLVVVGEGDDGRTATYTVTQK